MTNSEPYFYSAWCDLYLCKPSDLASSGFDLPGSSTNYRVDDLSVVHFAVEPLLLTTALTPLSRIRVPISQIARVVNIEQFCQTREINRKILPLLPTTSHSHDQVYSCLWWCHQRHWEGCNWCDSPTESPACHLCFNPNHVPPSASSTGLLLKMTGLKVTAIKIDPYMNIDAGTIRPQEHGGIKKRLFHSPQS